AWPAPTVAVAGGAADHLWVLTRRTRAGLPSDSCSCPTPHATARPTQGEMRAALPTHGTRLPTTPMQKMSFRLLAAAIASSPGGYVQSRWAGLRGCDDRGAAAAARA